MKVKSIEKPKIEFEPIEIVLIIESLAELANLAARLKLAAGTVYQSYEEEDDYLEGNIKGLEVNGFTLWQELDMLYQQRKGK